MLPSQAMFYSQNLHRTGVVLNKQVVIGSKEVKSGCNSVYRCYSGYFSVS